MMKKLEASELVRRKLPNTAAVMQQYFTYKRIQGESVSAYLVRETLFFEEFLESLMDLKDGPSMDFIFDELDPNTDEEDDDDGGASSNAGSKKKESPKGYEKIPQRDPDGGDPDEPGSRAASRAAPRGGPTSLSTTDSFILTQLRGWRLLSGASLNAEEWRSILASTKNQLDYDSVSSALMILFDEQAQHHRHAQAHGPVHSLHHVEEDDWGWQDDSSWDWSDPWANMAWESGDWYYENDAIEEAESTPPPEDQGGTGEPPQEALAADRSWSQAQRTSQMIRKDRGFGQSGQSSSHRGCFNCGGNHLARDCPDRHAPPHKGKGYGKNMHMAYDDGYDTMAFTKGKGKGKSSGKMAHLMEEFVNYYYYSKGKSKGNQKGKFQSKNRNNVNAYALDTFNFHGLQFDREPHEGALDLSKVEQENPGNLGMMDCGATCSAGPETSINRLVTSILAVDKSASVKIDGKRRLGSCPFPHLHLFKPHRKNI